MSNCQHCQTELTNPRAKNCKTCSDILTAANRAGSYSFVMEAIGTAKTDGLSGAGMQEVMRSAMHSGTARREEWAAEYRQRVEERRQAQSKRIRFEEDTRQDIEDLAEFERRQAATARTDQERADREAEIL